VQLIVDAVEAEPLTVLSRKFVCSYISK
jgi:hypothetical protein